MGLKEERLHPPRFPELTVNTDKDAVTLIIIYSWKKYFMIQQIFYYYFN